MLSSLTTKLIGGGIVALGLLFGLWYVYHLGQDSMKPQINALISAQKSNLSSISALKGANDACLARIKADQAKASTLVAELRKASQKRSQEAKSQQQRIKVIYEKSKVARDWASVPVPAALADELRQ